MYTGKHSEEMRGDNRMQHKGVMVDTVPYCDSMNEGRKLRPGFEESGCRLQLLLVSDVDAEE